MAEDCVHYVCNSSGAARNTAPGAAIETRASGHHPLWARCCRHQAAALAA